MRILELSLKNYRPFSGIVRFSFSSNFTVIAGINGRGKTAIIEGLALILSRLLPQISPARSGYRDIVPLDINGKNKEAGIIINTNCAGIPLKYSLKYFKENKQIQLSNIPDALRKEIIKAYGNPSISDDQAPLVVYYTTDRAGYRFPKTLPKIAPKGQAMAYNGALFNRTVDYEDFLARYRVAASKGKSKTKKSKGYYFNSDVINTINKAISIFLEGFTSLRVKDNPARILIQKNGQTRDLRQLSDGERSFIALICDLGRRLAIANPKLKNPLEGAGVVLIDEIELHLHPKWQLEVVEKLRKIFPNIQFIVTTHSPFVIQTARQGEVILLDKELVVDPYGKSLEEVARYVMDVKNTEYSPRIKDMKEIAKQYLQLAKEAKNAKPIRRQKIQKELIKMLAPFSDNPAYTALLESKGLI